MKHLSLLTALMLTSSMVYAGWITKGTEYKGDCLEMMCDCVEDSETRDGYCCPNGTSFNGKGYAHIEYTPCKCLEANTYYNTTTQNCLPKPTCNPCQKFDKGKGQCVADTSKNNQQTQDICHMCLNGDIVLKDVNKKMVHGDQCVQCLADGDCDDNEICDLKSKTCLSGSQKCLGKIERCGDDALGFMFEGQLYCYNTHEEFVHRCREAIPGRTSCSNNHGCFYAFNYYNEDYSGNCHWGYFDYTDAQNWCKGKGGRTLSKAEMEEVWSEFMKCTPSFGKHNESCYWTNTTACKTYNGNYNNARPDGYINAGGGFCKMN